MVRTFCLIFVALLGLAGGPFPARAQHYRPGTMMNGWGMEWGMGWFGGLLMILFWILVIVGVVFLVRWLMNAPQRDSSQKSPNRALEILKERYARGEIDKQEFEEKKKDLS